MVVDRRPLVRVVAAPAGRSGAAPRRRPADRLAPRPRPRKVSTAGFVAAKRAGLAAYTSQVTNLTGEDCWPVMDDALLGLFLGGYEVFLAPPRAANS